MLAIGLLGSLYAILGGLKVVAVSGTLNGYGLLIGGLAVPCIAAVSIGEGNLSIGITAVYNHAPKKM